MTPSSIAYIAAPHDELAHKRIKELGFTGPEIFEFDNWPEILQFAYNNEDTGRMYKLPKFKDKSADYFKKTGYKHSLVFQKLIKSGKGKLRCLIVEIGKGSLNSPEIRPILDMTLKHPKFKDLTLSYNVQIGQTPDSLHIQFLAFVPDTHKTPDKEFKIKIGSKFYTVKNDVELGKGKYSGQSMQIGVRKLVCYHRFPQDQRYRNWVDGAKLQAYREAYETHLENVITGLKINSSQLRGVRNMTPLVKLLTPEEIKMELSDLSDYQALKKACKEANRAARQASLISTITLPDPHPLDTLPADINPTFSDTPQDITQSIVNSILNYLDPAPLIIPFNPIKSPQFNLRI